ncbi:MAG: hypothetical protein ABEH35_07385 [Haloarculaceae archaeon]
MERRRLVATGVAILIVVAFTLGGVVTWFLIESGQDDSTLTRSTYRYELAVRTDTQLRNVTFRVPVPSTGGGSRIGQALLGGIGERPAGWELSMVTTESGPMLQIRAGTIGPHNESAGTVTQSARVLLPADRRIETRNPTGDEPLLRPRSSLVGISCTAGGDPVGCMAYEGRAYASYQTAAGANVTLEARITGENIWERDDELQRNAYVDFQRLRLRGPSRGWHTTGGRTWFGVGTYPGE